MNRYIKLTLVALILFSSNSSAEEPTLRVGAIYPLSGAASDLGTSNKRGAEIAVQLINQSGGIAGQKLEIRYEDSQSEPSTGVSAFQKLISVDKVPAILSTLTSVAMSVKPLADRSQTVLFAESTHPGLVSGSSYVFRHFFTSESGADAVEKFIVRKGLKRIAILHAQEEWGETAAEKLVSKLHAPRFEVVARESFAKLETDLKSQLLRIKQANPDFIYIVGLGAPIVAALRQRIELGLTIPCVGYVICGQEQVMNNAKEFMENVYSVDGFIDRDSSSYRLLAETHRKLYPDKTIDQSTVVAFDAVNFIAAAFRSGARSGKQIRRFLRTTKQLTGAMGTISFIESGDSVVPMTIAEVSQSECKELSEG